MPGIKILPPKITGPNMPGIKILPPKITGPNMPGIKKNSATNMLGFQTNLQTITGQIVTSCWF